MSEADPSGRSTAAANWHLGPIFDADAHIDPPPDLHTPAHALI